MSHRSVFFSLRPAVARCSWILLTLFVLTACKKEDDKGAPLPEKPILPIVMVHGLIGSGDSYELQMLRFASNDYPLDLLHTFEWNTLDPDFDRHIANLDALIESILLETGSDQIDLVGHSLGAVLSFDYCSRTERAVKIRHVALIGMPFRDTPAGTEDQPVPTLNIWSPFDRVVTTGTDIQGATNLKLQGKDHFEVASSVESFEGMYRFFRNKMPATSSVAAQANPVISGKVLSFAENISGEGATLEIFELDKETGQRLRAQADATFIIGSDNRWGPFQTSTGARYEFTVSTGKSGDRKLRFYKEPFVRENKNVIIRYSPPEGSLFKLVFDLLIPRNNDLAIKTYFNPSQATIVGRDKLFVDEIELSTPKFANPNFSTVALFLLDVNENGISDGTPIPLLREIPALSVGDVYFPVSADSISKFTFNGRTLTVPGSKSVEEGICIAVFD
jgi:pimeloyl-ACP methyl ester carboxylesterase